MTHYVTWRISTSAELSYTPFWISIKRSWLEKLYEQSEKSWIGSKWPLDIFFWRTTVKPKPTTTTPMVTTTTSTDPNKICNHPGLNPDPHNPRDCGIYYSCKPAPNYPGKCVSGCGVLCKVYELEIQLIFHLKPTPLMFSSFQKHWPLLRSTYHNAARPSHLHCTAKSWKWDRLIFSSKFPMHDNVDLPIF